MTLTPIPTPKGEGLKHSIYDIYVPLLPWEKGAGEEGLYQKERILKERGECV